MLLFLVVLHIFLNVVYHRVHFFLKRTSENVNDFKTFQECSVQFLLPFFIINVLILVERLTKLTMICSDVG